MTYPASYMARACFHLLVNRNNPEKQFPILLARTIHLVENHLNMYRSIKSFSMVYQVRTLRLLAVYIKLKDTKESDLQELTARFRTVLEQYTADKIGHIYMADKSRGVFGAKSPHAGIGDHTNYAQVKFDQHS